MGNNAGAGFREHHFKSADGLTLYARDYGTDNPETARRLPVVCLAGLTRNSRDFHDLAVILSTDADAPRRVVTIDTRGRGQSDRDPDPTHYNIITEAGDVIAGCAALGIARAAFIGTSRGGLILHVLAAANPGLLGAVILNDVGPAIGMDGLRLIQAYLGKRITFPSMDAAAAALKAVHSVDFPNVPDAEWKSFADATFREEDGVLVADCDPAIGEEMAKIDLSEPLPEMWEQFDAFRGIPLMTIRGGNSVLLTADILDRMKARNPDMAVLVAENHGHAPLLHLDGIPEKIKDFLKSV